MSDEKDTETEPKVRYRPSDRYRNRYMYEDTELLVLLETGQLVLVAVVAISAVGILASNIRGARFIRKMINTQTADVAKQKQALEWAIKNKRAFYHFPGLGVYVHATSS